MTAIILTKDELTRAEVEDLWKQGVCMDDWDYVIVAPVSSVSKSNSTDDGEREYPYQQEEYTFERCLTGCCSNGWHRVTFRGEDVAFGVAYHS